MWISTETYSSHPAEILEIDSSFSINSDGQLMDISNSVQNLGADNMYDLKLFKETFVFSIPTLCQDFVEGKRPVVLI